MTIEPGLRSGRGKGDGGECLISGCTDPAGETLLTFNVPGFGELGGYVCRSHARLVQTNVLRGLSLDVTPRFAPEAADEAEARLRGSA